MIFVSIFIFVNSITALALIIPKNHLNNRLSYSNGPKIINSSLNEETLKKNYFNLPDEFTYLVNGGNALCSKNGVDLIACSKSAGN